MPGIKPLNLPDTIRADKLVEKTPGHTIEVTANIVIPNIPTVSTGLVEGQLWRDPSNNWLRVAAKPPGQIGVFPGGRPGNDSITIDTLNISTAGSVSDFGDLIGAQSEAGGASNGADQHGVIAGGYSGSQAQLMILDTPGNAVSWGTGPGARALSATSNGSGDRGLYTEGIGGDDIYYRNISVNMGVTFFGALVSGRSYHNYATSNGLGQRGIFVGGYQGGTKNVIEKVTIDTLGNSSDFGDLVEGNYALVAASNDSGQRCVVAGGASPHTTRMQYFEIDTPANAQDFGNLSQSQSSHSAASNGIDSRAVSAGGYTSGSPTSHIDHFGLTTLQDGANFGDLLEQRSLLTCGMSNGAA